MPSVARTPNKAGEPLLEAALQGLSQRNSEGRGWTAWGNQPEGVGRGGRWRRGPFWDGLIPQASTGLGSGSRLSSRRKETSALAIACHTLQNWWPVTRRANTVGLPLDTKEEGQSPFTHSGDGAASDQQLRENRARLSGLL